MRSFPEQVSQEWVDGEVDSWNKLGREREAGWKKEGWTGIVAAPGKRRIKSFGTWKSTGFERKGEKETVSLSPAPYSGLLSLLLDPRRPSGLGSGPL